MKLVTAKKIAKDICSTLSAPRTLIVGSIRRKLPEIKDIDILIVNKDVELASKAAVDDIMISGDWKVIEHGKRRCRFVRIDDHIRLDIFFATPQELPFALLHHTGSAAFNIRVRAHAKRLGYKLNQYGLFDANGNIVHISGKCSEKKIVQFLGVTYKSPSNRI